MIIQEENDLLTQTSAGTPCGELMRRYWQPAALSEELTADKPLAVQLFGEELILVSDGAGKPALIGRYCAHQGVDMIYGRVEEDGLRCMYHGWLFDNCGKVVLRGDWLPEKERRWNVGQAAYPCVENGGVIFTYMAPGDPPPSEHELLATSLRHGALTKIVHEENYVHRIVAAHEQTFNRARYVLPNLVIIQNATAGAENWARWYVPANDNSHVEFALQLNGKSLSLGEPLDAWRHALRKAIEKIQNERQSPLEPGA
jgi:phenylpropionate dioxygenase-like ring-hydroxylating dioxygenase large terminal subunit